MKITWKIIKAVFGLSLVGLGYILLPQSRAKISLEYRIIWVEFQDAMRVRRAAWREFKEREKIIKEAYQNYLQTLKWVDEQLEQMNG